MILLGTISLVYGAFAALRQGSDAKRVVAYSSLSHLGLILIAIFSFDAVCDRGRRGVHRRARALSAPRALPRARRGRAAGRDAFALAHGGMGLVNPRLAGALCIAALAALGLPGLCGFTGEILILSGIFRSGALWPTLLALAAVVLAAAYMLRLFQGIMHGPQTEDLPERPDLRWSEGLALAPLVVGMVWLGVAPGAVTRAIPTAPLTGGAMTQASQQQPSLAINAGAAREESR